MTATENVGKFLHLKEKMEDSAVIAGVATSEGRAQLLTADVAALLDEVEELREQLADRIAPVGRTDTIVHVIDPPLDFGLLPGTPVRFSTGPESHEYVQVHCDGDDGGWVHITGWPNLTIQPGAPGFARVRPAQR